MFVRRDNNVVNLDKITFFHLENKEISFYSFDDKGDAVLIDRFEFKTEVSAKDEFTKILNNIHAIRGLCNIT